LTVDHVLPRSRGGGTTWENCVAACYSCNSKKGCRTPREAGMELRSRPARPARLALWEAEETPSRQSWERFVSRPK
jgi:5-methylcytosine-specific restriction endonuclease McrA